jgi:ribosomal protein S4
MTLHGKILNGVVVLEPGVRVTEGTEVSVLISATTSAPGASAAEERERRRKALAELLAVPDENPHEGS